MLAGFETDCLGVIDITIEKMQRLLGASGATFAYRHSYNPFAGGIQKLRKSIKPYARNKVVIACCVGILPVGDADTRTIRKWRTHAK
jgi:hypothetical protein